MKRRAFLTRVGAVVSAAALPLKVGAQRSGFVPDVELELRASPGTVSLAAGAPTRVWSYSGRLLKGPAATLQPVPGSYLGPTIRVQTGQRIRVHFTNDLPERTIVHWHGLDVPSLMDGHPRLMVPTGKSYVYEFEVVNRAGTYWYHPHHHDRTGPQVYQGLAGLLVVSDPSEAALTLPTANDEILCVLQDRSLAANNQLVYVSGTPMDGMTGFLGDRVFVNGRPASPLSLATRAYRVRLLNGSNSRVYKLAWSDQTVMTVIGTDGGLLERPVERPYLTLAPGERAELVLDLSRRDVGSRLELRSLAFPSRAFEAQMGMGGGRGRGRGMRRGPGAAPANGAPLDILTIVVNRRERSTFELPPRLSAYDGAWHADPPTPNRVVNIDFRMMRFLLDGRAFDMEGVAANETIPAGAKQTWEFDNSGPAMMNMRLAHPLHLHGRQFRVLRRSIDPAWASDWQSLRDGFVDEGWKDTVLVMPGERVQILVQFSKYPGLYLYHCHNLEHEDMGMMRNYRLT